jgi:hypothetical protein
MRQIFKEVKAIYLNCKGKTYNNLTQAEKNFLYELQNQAVIMRDFCRELSREDIIDLINTCKTDIQLELALRPRNVA